MPGRSSAADARRCVGVRAASGGRSPSPGDPASGEAAFTGVVQVTALAPSALRAEMYAKAAILSGPRAASSWLAHGGVIVFDDGSHEVIEPRCATIDPPPRITLSELSAFAQPTATHSAEAG